MGYSDLEGDKLTFMQKVQNNWNGFRKFMWNPDERTVMGRGGKSWAKISLFYLVFFSCLAGFWAAMLAIFLQTVSFDRPKWTAFVSTPTLDSVMVLDDERRIRWEPANEESVERIITPLREIYDILEREDADLEDCTDLPVGSIEEAQRFCKFNVDMLGECKPPNFGWDSLKPCLFLRLNRVYGWTPENYETPEDVPKRIRSVYQENNIAVNCFQRVRRGNKEVKLNSTMPFPKAGIPFGFFPYILGAYKPEDRNRLIQPVVAVQISLKGHNQAVHIECQAYTGNIAPRGGLFDTDQESQIRLYLDPRKKEE